MDVEAKALGLLMLVGGLSLGIMVGWRTQEHHDVTWVEACWPNKPVWVEYHGTCWVDGQKVIIDQ